MLDKILKRFQGAVVVILVLMLSAVFVLEFGGPQSRGCAEGGATYAARVRGRTISDGEFRANYVLSGANRYEPDRQEQMGLKEKVLDGLIERTLLAEQARALGFEVTDLDVSRELAENASVLLWMGVNPPFGLRAGEVFLPEVRDEDGNFDSDQAKRFIQYYLRRSVGEFTEAQVEERLAHRMRELVTSSVTVSPREVWDSYVEDTERVTLKYIQFSASHYRESLNPTTDELRAWIGEHQEEVDREYQAQRHRYTGLERQVRARHVLIKADESASEADKAAARARAEQILARARAGEDFAALATANSEDEGSARRGGDLGYNPRGRMVEAFDEAQFGLEPGQISDVVESRFGFHVIKVEGVREGDVPEDEAKLELAERLYRDTQASASAGAAAAAAMAALRSGTTWEAYDRQLQGLPPEAVDAQTGDDGQAGEPENAPPTPDSDEPGADLSPRVQETSAFGRTDAPIRGPFDPSALVTAAFELTAADPLPEEPLKLGDDYFVFGLLERVDANREDFDEDTNRRYTDRLLGQKQREVLALYIQRLREQAEADGAIRIGDQALSYDAEDPEDEGDGEEQAPPEAEGEEEEG